MPFIRENVPLAPFTTLAVGGRARYWAELQQEDDLPELLDWAKERGLPHAILAGGSNTLVADAGFPGLVIHVLNRGIEKRESAREGFVRMAVAAGEVWDGVVQFAVEQGLAGIECLAGIPGSTGATPIQNVGAYGQEVAQTVVEVRAYDLRAQRFETLQASDLAFAYRHSRFKSEPGRWVVSKVVFELRQGAGAALAYEELRRHFERLAQPRPGLEEVRRAVIELRRAKSMVLDPSDPNHRSAGSFFLNPIVPAAAFAELQERHEALVGEGAIPHWSLPDGRIKLSAAWLIEQSGFHKGFRQGEVGISSKHALALVTYEGASSQALLDFAEALCEAVRQRYGIRLEREPQLLA